MTESPRTLLFIDDDPLVSRGIIAYLEESGYRVLAENSGAAGLERFERERPDLVLTDLRMPDLDGLSLLKAIKERDASVPVIVISGVGLLSDVVQALRLGAADYLTKPLADIKMLTHAIERALAVLDLQRENARYRAELERANRELSEYVAVLERDQRAGRQVQMNLLPPTPQRFGGVELAHKILPSLYLSGDLVDYGAIHHRHLCFYLADVSGHGASSAFVTVWLKQWVRRLLRERRAAHGMVDIAELMSVINRKLCRSNFGCHITAVVGILDLTTRALRYVVAGHLPLPVLLTDAGAVYMEGKGKPLGLFESAIWSVYECQLPVDFAMLLFSDGVLEILPRGGLAERERLLLDRMTGTRGEIAAMAEALNLPQVRDAPDDIALFSLRGGHYL